MRACLVARAAFAAAVAAAAAACMHACTLDGDAAGAVFVRLFSPFPFLSLSRLLFSVYPSAGYFDEGRMSMDIETSRTAGVEKKSDCRCSR
ncbi:hypothetical protein IWX49DRAFT_562153 [Phyllosticta citricarpa]